MNNILTHELKIWCNTATNWAGRGLVVISDKISARGKVKIAWFFRIPVPQLILDESKHILNGHDLNGSHKEELAGPCRCFILFKCTGKQKSTACTFLYFMHIYILLFTPPTFTIIFTFVIYLEILHTDF